MMTCAVQCRRRTYRPDAITWAEIEPEAETGKQFRLPVKDKEGRAVLLMRPRSAHKLLCPATLTEWPRALQAALLPARPCTACIRQLAPCVGYMHVFHRTKTSLQVCQPMLRMNMHVFHMLMTTHDQQQHSIQQRDVRSECRRMVSNDDYTYDCRNENTKGAERQLKFLVYCLEAACRAADEAGDQGQDHMHD